MDEYAEMKFDDRHRDLAGALQVLRTSVYTPGGGDRRDVPDWAIVVVDGPSADRASTEAEAARVRAGGVRLSAIGVGPSRVDVDELTAVVTTPSDDLYVFDYLRLADGFAQRFICTNLALKGRPRSALSGFCRRWRIELEMGIEPVVVEGSVRYGSVW